MPVAIWTPKAERDLEDILYYIRVTDGRPQTARRIGEELLATVENQAVNPTGGANHPAVPSAWKYFRYKRWLVFFQPLDDSIEVMRVVDGVRDLPRVINDSL